MMRRLAIAMAERIAITAPVRWEPMRVFSATKAAPAMTNSTAIRARSLSGLIRVMSYLGARRSPQCKVDYTYCEMAGAKLLGGVGRTSRDRCVHPLIRLGGATAQTP